MPVTRRATAPARTATTARTAAKAKAKPRAKKTKADDFEKKKPAAKKPAQTEAAAAVKPAKPAIVDAKTPPSLSGKLTFEGGAITLNTRAGQFQIVNVNDFSDSTHTFGGQDIQAFLDKTVTVRGWPEEGWQPGQQGLTRLAVEEWAPGSSPDFVAGRILVSGDDVFVRVRTDKKVKIVDPQLKAVFKELDALGVVLPGEVTKKGDDWSFTSAPKDYYLLAGFSTWGGGTPQVGPQTVNATIQLAHGKNAPAELPTEAWNAIPRQQRHYFYGHFEDGAFKGKGFTRSAGPWALASGVTAGPNAAFRTAAEKSNAKPPEGGAGSFEP